MNFHSPAAPVYDRLLHEAEVLQREQEKRDALKAAEELKGATFAPEIPDSSKAILKRKVSDSASVFDRLLSSTATASPTRNCDGNGSAPAGRSRSGSKEKGKVLKRASTDSAVNTSMDALASRLDTLMASSAVVEAAAKTDEDGAVEQLCFAKDPLPETDEPKHEGDKQMSPDQPLGVVGSSSEVATDRECQ